jgi:hypothetical protein
VRIKDLAPFTATTSSAVPGGALRIEPGIEVPVRCHDINLQQVVIDWKRL